MQATMSPVTTTTISSSGSPVGSTVAAVASSVPSTPSASPSSPSVTIAVANVLVSSNSNSISNTNKTSSTTCSANKLPELASISARIAILTANQSKSYSPLSGSASRRQLSPPPPPLSLLSQSLLLTTATATTTTPTSVPTSPVPSSPTADQLSLSSHRTSVTTQLSDHNHRGQVISIILSEEDEEIHLHHPDHPHHQFNDDYEDEGFNEENGSSHSNVSGSAEIIATTVRPKLSTIEVPDLPTIDCSNISQTDQLEHSANRSLERTTSDTTTTTTTMYMPKSELDSSASPSSVTSQSPPYSPSFSLSSNQKCQMVPNAEDYSSDQTQHHHSNNSSSPSSPSPSAFSLPSAVTVPVPFTSHTLPSSSKSKSSNSDQHHQQQQQQLPLHLRRANVLITGPNGSIRGKRNIVRKSVSNYTQLVKQANLEKGEQERDFVKEERNKCVLYVTTLGIIRKTFEESKQIKALLKNNFIEFDERDVYINEEFKHELRQRMGNLGEQLQIPILFEKGQKLGGFSEIEKLNELGQLVQRLNRYCNTLQCSSPRSPSSINENLGDDDDRYKEDYDEDEDDEDEYDDNSLDQDGNDRPSIISTKLLNTKSKQLVNSSRSIGSAASGPWRECGRCGGTKFVNCVKCKGSRKTYIHHFDCASVTLKCSQCRKTGLVRCPDCS